MTARDCQGTLDGMGTPLQRAGDLAAGLVADIGDAWLDPDKASSIPGEPLDRLAELRKLQHVTEEATTTAVQKALDAGASWQGIGDVFGVTRQAAHERWGRRLAARRLI